MSQSSKSDSILALEENPSEVYLQCSEVLLRVASNILKDPANPKYRSLSLGSNVVTNKLLPAVGAIECLFEMGFQEGVDKLILPQEAPLDSIQQIYNELLRGREEHMKQKNCGNNVTIESTSQLASSNNSLTSTKTGLSQLSSSIAHPFLKKIVLLCIDVLKYENKELQLKALRCIPLPELYIKVQKNLRKIQWEIKKKEIADQVIDDQELLLIEVTDWFKKDFFKWIDTPECRSCGANTVAAAGTSVQWQGSDRVENFCCPVCQKKESFVRYNNPEMLLQTRRGRCGEWANCFTLICRSLGWDARLVIDSTDHVWTEVYSRIQKRWLHCDPCENMVDAPLLYEGGWGKKLSYIMAYSCDDVQDVTWRYSCHHKEVLSRRTECSEEELLQTISNIRKVLSEDFSGAKKKYVTQRCALELVELLKEGTLTAAATQGRTSGSLLWRLSRGETGARTVHEPFVWKLENKDLENLKFILRYSTAKDEYVVGAEKTIIAKSWYKGLHSMRSIIRKEETDWKMVYLARAENSDVGVLSWRFEADNDFVIDEVQLKLESTTYESGKVLCKLCANGMCVEVPNSKEMFLTNAISGAKSCDIIIELTGGNGNCAWQHAQILRQPFDSNEHGFLLVISLKRT